MLEYRRFCTRCMLPWRIRTPFRLAEARGDTEVGEEWLDGFRRKHRRRRSPAIGTWARKQDPSPANVSGDGLRRNQRLFEPAKRASEEDLRRQPHPLVGPRLSCKLL
jgi:hypothetical protein